jgi:hypothetical protein
MHKHHVTMPSYDPPKDGRVVKEIGRTIVPRQGKEGYLPWALIEVGSVFAPVLNDPRSL